jgi:HD-like signal output (HDOD) protein
VASSRFPANSDICHISGGFDQPASVEFNRVKVCQLICRYKGKDLEEIPTLRESKLRLFTILEDDSSDIRDVEHIIESDPAMAAKVIRIANSAFYRFTKKVQSIHDAIMVIGFDMVRCITLSMSVMQSFGSNERIAKEIWRHSFQVALSAMCVARDREERGSFFSGGLLHDLGRVVLLRNRSCHARPERGGALEIPALGSRYNP